MNEQILCELLRSYPEALNDRKILLGLLRDMFPSEMSEINLLLYSFDIGIVDEIQKNELDLLLFNRLKNKIKSDYKVEDTFAEWSVQTWFSVYGNQILNKKINLHTACDVSITVLNEDLTNDISLTVTQQKAVDSTSKKIAVIAGPGSGKTRVLTERIVSLVKKHEIPEHKILALSFSSKAAKEMKRRLVDRLGKQAYKIEVKTFHSFGLQIISQNYDLIGLSEEFEILSGSSKNKYLRQILKSNGIPENEIISYSQSISKLKNGENSINKQILSVSKQYNDVIHGANCIDFDDMVTLATKILKDNPNIQTAYQNCYTHILVDEVQDLNENQTEIIGMLMTAESSLFIVGDDDQCIYEWRGAKPNFLKDVTKDKQFEVIKLEDNFRSDKSIVDVSSSLINNNENRISKLMQSRKKRKSKVTINANSTQALRFQDADAEARFISGEIQKLLSDGYKNTDIAILVRSAKQAPQISAELSRLGIPCFEQLTESTAYDEIIPVLRAITRIKAKNTLNRAINYPITVMDNFLFTDLQEQFQLDTSLSVFDSFDKLYANGKQFDDCEVFRARYAILTKLNLNYKTMASSDVLQELYNQYSFEAFANTKKVKEKLEHLQTLIEIAKDFDSVFDADKAIKSRLEEFIDYLTLSSQDDSGDNAETDGVNLMTCHKSKGLEFPIVFIPGVQVGVFPNDFFISSKEDIEAERRLFYVSMTRAIEKLYVTCFADPFIGKGYVKKGFMAEIPGVKISN